MTDVEAVRDAVARADAETPLRTVVANAGVAFQRPLPEVEPEQFDRRVEAVTLTRADRAIFPDEG